MHRRKNAIMAKITMTKRYMSLWYACLIMPNVLVGNFRDSLQLTNWILDSGEMCHMMPEVSDFIPDS